MAGEIAFTVSQVAPAYRDSPSTILRDYTVGASGSIYAGQAIYLDSSGNAQLASAAAVGTAAVKGICLSGTAANPKTAGEVIRVLVEGELYGYTLGAIGSGVAVDAVLYVSDTAGSIATQQGTKLSKCGRVTVLNDPSRTKVIIFKPDWNVIPA